MLIVCLFCLLLRSVNHINTNVINNNIVINDDCIVFLRTRKLIKWTFHWSYFRIRSVVCMELWVWNKRKAFSMFEFISNLLCMLDSMRLTELSVILGLTFRSAERSNMGQEISTDLAILLLERDTAQKVDFDNIISICISACFVLYRHQPSPKSLPEFRITCWRDTITHCIRVFSNSTLLLSCMACKPLVIFQLFSPLIHTHSL